MTQPIKIQKNTLKSYLKVVPNHFQTNYQVSIETNYVLTHEIFTKQSTNYNLSTIGDSTSGENIESQSI